MTVLSFSDQLISKYVWGKLWLVLLIFAPVFGLTSALTLKKGMLVGSTIVTLCMLTPLTPFMIFAEQKGLAAAVDEVSE